MSTDRITFKCLKCGHAVSVDNDNLPTDDDILKCFGCGHEFGRYADVREAMVKAINDEIDRRIHGALGVKPTWTKK